jgi:hypothetical protein
MACRPMMNYKYRTSMQPATRQDSLIYENDSMRIKFTLEPQLVKFRYDNKLNEGVRINWDEVSISIGGKSYRVVHKETGTYKINEIQPTTSIPPRSYMIDGLIPTDKITYTRYGSSSIITVGKIFPTNDYGSKKTAEQIKSLKGKSIIVYLPVYINNKFSTNSFEIKINDIVATKL